MPQPWDIPGEDVAVLDPSASPVPEFFPRQAPQVDVSTPPVPTAEPGFWAGMKAGFGETANRPSQLVPFLGSGIEAKNAIQLYLAAKRVEAGGEDDSDLQLLKTFNDENQAKAPFKDNLGYTIARIVSQLPGFAGELGLTGPFYAGARVAGEKVALKAAQELITGAAEKAAVKWAARQAARVGAAAVQTAAARGPAVVGQAFQRMTPGVAVGEDPSGKLRAIIESPGDDAFQAFTKSFGDQFVEVLTEHSGKKLMDALGAAGKYTGISKAVDAFKDLTPIQRLSGFKQAVANNYLRVDPDIEKFLGKLTGKLQWHGVLGEMMEERFGEVLKPALGIEPGYTPPTLNQLLAEAIAFSVPSGAIKGAGVAATKVRGIRSAMQEETDNAQRVRSDTGQPDRARETGRRSEADRERNLEQAAPRRPEPLAAGEGIALGARAPGEEGRSLAGPGAAAQGPAMGPGVGAGLPAVPPGMVRVYRGQYGGQPGKVPDWFLDDPDYAKHFDVTGRWWTPSLENAAWYKNEVPDDKGVIVYQDIPASVYEQAKQEHAIKRYSRRPEEEIFLPPEYKSRGKPLELGAGIAQSPPTAGTTTPEQTPAAVGEWFHASHSDVRELLPRAVTSVDTFGTWVTGNAETARTLYGPKVVKAEVAPKNLLKAHTDSFDDFFFSNRNLFRELFPDAQTAALERFKEKGLAKTDPATASMRETYLRAFRKMLQDAGYDGVIWKDSRIDLRAGDKSHDVAVLFHDEPVRTTPSAVGGARPEQKQPAIEPEADPFIYHATTRFKAENIRREGIAAGSWFAKTPHEALAFTERNPDSVVFAVRKSDIVPIPAASDDIFGQEFQRVGLFKRSGKRHVPVGEVKAGAERYTETKPALGPAEQLASKRQSAGKGGAQTPPGAVLGVAAPEQGPIGTADAVAKARAYVDQWRPMFAALGATVAESGSVAGPAETRMASGGVLALAVNPDLFGKSVAGNEALGDTVLFQEFIHGAEFRVLERFWKEAGSQGTLEQYVMAYYKAIYDELPATTQQYVASAYGTAEPWQYGGEFMRMLREMAVKGQITEQVANGLTERVMRLLRELVKYVKELVAPMADAMGNLPAKARYLYEQTDKLIKEVEAAAARGKQVAVGTNEDTHYLELAKDPEKNRDELQRMVDAAAKRAAERMSAQAVSVSHGTDEARAEFDGGAFFTDSERDASAYAELRALHKAVEDNDELSGIVNDILSEEGGESITDLGPKTIRDIAEANDIPIETADGVVLNGYVFLKNTLDLTKHGSDIGNLDRLWNQLHKAGLVEESWADIDEEFQNEIEQKYDGKALYLLLEQEDVLAKAFKNGFDSVKFIDISPDGGKTHTTWLTETPNQFKSRDPVTYDAAGQVIPLSQRFNPEKSSILYAKSPVSLQARVTTPEEARNVMDFAGLQGQAASQIEATGIVSQNEFLNRAGDWIRANYPHISQAAIDRLGIEDIAAIQGLGEQVVGPDTYARIKAGMIASRSPMLGWMIKQAAERVALQDRRYRDVVAEFQEQLEFVKTESFIKQAGKRDNAKYDSERADINNQRIRDIVTDGIAKAKIEAARQGASQQQIDDAEVELQMYSGFLGKVDDVRNAADDIVRKLAIDETDEGLSLFMDDDYKRDNEIVTAYFKHVPRPTPTFTGQNERLAVIKAAAFLLARARDLRHIMFAAELEKQTSIQAELSTIDAAVLRAFKSKGSHLLTNLVKKIEKTAVKKERARFVWQKLHREVSSQLEKLRWLNEAAEAADAVLAWPAWVAYRHEVLTDAGMYIKPEGSAGIEPGGQSKFGAGGTSFADQIVIVMPDGSLPKIQLYGDKAKWEEELLRLNGYLDTLNAWVEANPNDPTVPFFEQQIEKFEYLFKGSMMLKPTKFRVPFFQALFGMLKFLPYNLGTRAGTLVRMAIADFDSSVNQADIWAAKHISPVENALFKAAESHGFTKGQSPGAAVEQWYGEVGRELNGDWQQAPGGPKTGDRLSNGHKVTPEDMAALNVSSKANEAGFDLVDPRSGKGLKKVSKGTSPPPLIDETLEPGLVVSRPVTPPSAKPLFRTWNPKAVDWAQKLVKDIREGDVEKPDWMNIVEKSANARFWEMMLSVISNRTADWATFDARYDRAYKAAAEHIKNNGLLEHERNLNWFYDFIVNRGIGELEEIRKYVLSDIKSIATRVSGGVDAALAEDNTETNIEVLEQHNSFTRPRTGRVAPNWFYNTGFSNTASLLNFKSWIPSFYFEQLVRALKIAKGDLERQKSDLDAKIGELSNLTLSPAERPRREKQIVTDNAAAVLRGETLDDYEKIAKNLGDISKIISDVEDVYQPGGQHALAELQTIRRILGQAVTGVLANVKTTARNVLWGWYYLGAKLHALSGSLTWSYGHAFMVSLRQSSKFIGSLGVSLVKGYLLDAPIETFKTLSATGSPRKAAKAGLFAALGEIAQGAFERVDDYHKMVAAGYLAPYYAAQEIEAKIHFPTTGGAVAAPDYSKFAILAALQKFGGATLNYWDVLTTIAPLTSKAIFPRIGDAALNAASMRASFDFLQLLQHRLWKTYQVWEKLGPQFHDLSNPGDPLNALRPNEVYPQYFKFEAQKGLSLELLISQFARAQLPFQESVIEYFQKLKAGDQNAQFLDDAQRLAFATTMVEDVNKGTPSNRPMFTRKANFLNMVFAPLMGWNFHTFRELYQYLGRVASDPKAGRLILYLAVLAFIFPALALAAPARWLDLGVMRKIRRWLEGEEAPDRLPWERSNPAGVAKQIALDIATAIPFVSMAVNSALNDQVPRASAQVDLFALSKVRDLLNYAGGAWNTGDIAYGLPRLVTGFVPGARVILNRLPATEGTVEMLNARRLLTRYGQEELLAPKTGGTQGTANALTPYGERVMNAVGREDWASFDKLKAEFIAKATEMGRPEPEKLFAQVVASRSPYARAFKQKLTAGQREAMLGRMSERERAIVLESERKLLEAGQRIGKNITFEKSEALPGGTGGSRTAAGFGSFGGTRAFGSRTGRARRFGSLRRGFAGLKVPRIKVGRLGSIRSGRSRSRKSPFKAFSLRSAMA